MGSRHDITFTRDDEETEVEVEYEVTSWGSAPVTSGPPEHCDPGDPPEFEIVSILDGNTPVVLTAAEAKRLDDEIMEAIGSMQLDDGPDPDDYRDDDR